MEEFWQEALAVGGLGVVGAFVFYSLYKSWLKLPIFSKLTKRQTFTVVLAFLGLTFLALIVILKAYIDSQEVNKPLGIGIASNDPCATYDPDVDFIDEMMDQAQKQAEMEVGGNADSIQPVIRNAVAIGRFSSWVVDCGKPQGVYEREFSSTKYRMSVSPRYQLDGLECLNLSTSTRKEGIWSASTETYCRNEGSWIKKLVD